MTHSERTRVEIVEERLAVDLATSIDLSELRLGFRDLSDRAAARFLRLGYDFDDVELDRVLTCRTTAGEEFEVCDPPLSDAARLCTAIGRRAATVADEGEVSAELRIVELKVVVWREPVSR